MGPSRHDSKIVDWDVKPQHKQTIKTNITRMFCVTEVSLNPQDWAERQIQQYYESQRRSLSRIRSTESMPMSSPLQNCEGMSINQMYYAAKFR